MVLSDLSIRRPVFAAVMSLLLIVIGAIAFTQLSLRELPAIDPPIVSIQTEYPGASAAVVETRITQVLEDAVSGIEGIETIESSSRNGAANITIEFLLSRDIESAANDVRSAVSRVANRLPEEARAPEIEKVESDADVIIWLNISSPRLDIQALTDYADRYVVDRLSSLPGVAQVRLGGGQRYAMRIWLDGAALAARGLTVADIEQALNRENVELPAGRLESQTRDFTLRISRSYAGAEDFAKLVLRQGEDGQLVRLGDVARVSREAEERRAYFRGNGQQQVGLGIIKTSTSNALDVAKAVRAQIEQINRGLPPDISLGINFDSTEFIDVAVNQVYTTLAEAIVLVLIVIWLFLGTLRAALVPAVTVPVCLVAAFIALWLFGYSINLLTLLAIILCIGLVVDDAIVVLENCQRRVDLGEPPIVAARRGTAQVAFAVIATTAVLVAVFLPIAFLEGNNGRLFRELAVAMAGAIAISAFVALTLTPMMCSLLLRRQTPKPKSLEGRMSRWLAGITELYQRSLTAVIDRVGLASVIMLIATGLIFVIANQVPRELAPPEDRGAFFVSVAGPEGAGFDYTVAQMAKIEEKLMDQVTDRSPEDTRPIWRLLTRVPGGFGASEEMHTGNAVVLMRPWDERDITTAEMVEQVRPELAKIPGIVARPIVRSGLIRSRGQPLQIVLGGPEYDELAQWRDRLLARIDENPQIFGADSDYKETRPQLRVDIDRERAASLGVSVEEIGRTLETMMGSRRVTTYVDQGEEYDVILQANKNLRATPQDLLNLYVRARSGELIPLASLVSLRELAEPGSYNRFNRLRAITISAGVSEGYPLGSAIEWIRQVAAEELPETAQLDFKGESREYLDSGSAVIFTFVLALLIVYLVLAAQFESFAHPWVIMLTVPLAIFGALLGLWLMGGTLNLFSQIGLVMLIGLAAKNGILIVEFANQRRDEGLDVREAIIDAATTRLRPILMTSIATVAGAMPLMLSGGAGSASRNTIGIVIVFGVTLSTFLTLYVIPAIYRRIAPLTSSPHARGNELDRLEAATPDAGNLKAENG